MSPDAMIDALFTDAAEGMGTMDYTPYLVLRGWRWHGRAGQPGLDYLTDPVEGGPAILNLIGVSRQLVRDGAATDEFGFMRHARYCAVLPEPILTEVKAFRERQAAAGLTNHGMPPAIPAAPLPVTTQEIVPVDDFPSPPPLDPYDGIDQAASQPLIVRPRRLRRRFRSLPSRPTGASSSSVAGRAPIQLRGPRK